MKILSFVLRMVGMLILLLGIVSLMGGVRFIPLEDGGIIFVAAGLVAAVGGSSLLLFSKRLSARTYDQVACRDPRSPVLFLRSFATDRFGQRSAAYGWWRKLNYAGSLIPLNLTTQDEQMELALDDFGPLKALARPGAWLHLAGIPTIVVPNEDWERVVLENMHSAALVVIRVEGEGVKQVKGKGDSLKWEIRQVFGQADRRNIVFILPASQKKYDEFATFLTGVIGQPLPEFKVKRKIKDCSGFLYFTAEGAPTIQALPKFFFRPEGNVFNTTAIYFKMMLVKIYPQIEKEYIQATVKDRIKAFAFDLLLLLPASVLIAGIMAGIGWIHQSNILPVSALIGAGLLLFVYPFFAELFSTKSTWGMRKAGIYISDKVHVKPSRQQLFFRNFFRLFCLILLNVLLVPYVIMAWYKGAPMLHDLASRTRVFKTH